MKSSELDEEVERERDSEIDRAVEVEVEDR